MRLTFSLIAFSFMLSCAKDVKPVEVLTFSITDLPQTWQLTSINAGLSGEIIDAEDLTVQEIYVFNANGAFSKEFQDDFVQGTADGTFTLTMNEEVEYLELNYSVDMDSLSYCSRDSVEHMLVSENGEQLSNRSCMAFDGPGLYYKRID